MASPVLSESRSATGSTSPFQGLTRVNYTNQAFPTTGITFFAISYYDDYNFDMPDLSVPTVNFYGDTLTTSAKGLLTGTRIKALAPSTWSNTLTGYDDKGQPIWWSDNRNAYFGTENISDSQLAELTEANGRPNNSRTISKLLDAASLVLSRLDILYQEGDIRTKREIISSIFPEKICFDGNECRTFE